MSKINQIQKGLRELEGGAFQKLADEYLRKKGYERLNPIGSVIGTNKVRKGTPDTLVALENGKYAFCEHTTEANGLFAKIKSDLEKCFDYKKTGIPIKKIAEIVVCHTSLLDPAEEHELREMCQRRKVILSLFGIGPLSHDLYEHYPKLAHDHLGIEVDTGQIVTAADFVTTYNKGAFATPLDTEFRFREAEVDQVLQALEEVDLIIVSGRPGCGKTRLALECCAKFAESHPDFEFRCVFNRGPDLFQDLQFHFSAPRHHLILVDDANRLNRFEYALQLLHKQGDQRRVKIVATVRDYAVESILEQARPFGNMKEVDLGSFGDDEIKSIVEHQFSIRNHHFLDRIAEVSRGNPRIAIMAAQVANRENTLYALRDVSSLYDEYYRSIRLDFQDIGKKDLLKAAGILAFFRTIDRSNTELMQAIEAAFGIKPDAFWEAIRQLHALEAVDLYEDEVVRVSDQVLATYLFYLSIFRERVLSFSSILTQFFPNFSYRIIDVLNPILSVFDVREVMEALRPHVDETWRRLEASGDEESLLRLMHLFWPLRETEILLFIRERVARMNAEPVDLDNLETKPDSNIRNPSLLSLLGVLHNSNLETTGVVLSTLYDLLSKRPGELPRVVHLLQDEFGFRHTSGLQGYAAQRAVIDVLWERTREGGDPLFVRLFFAIAGNYLQTHFHNSEPKEGNALVMYNFDIPACTPIFELRKAIWDRLFRLYRCPGHREGVFDILRNYHPYGQAGSMAEIVSMDAAEVCEFFQKELDPTVFRDCRLVHGFLDTLEFHGIGGNEELRRRFRGEAFNLYEVLAESHTSRLALNLGFAEFSEYKNRKIAAFFQDVDLPGYRRVFTLCREILDEVSQSHDVYRFLSGLIEALIHLAGRSPTPYSKVIEEYLNDGNRLKLHTNDAGCLSAKLVEVCGAETADTILGGPDYVSKSSWLFGFFVALPAHESTASRLDEVCRLYQEADLADIPHHMDYLIKFQATDERAVVRVVQILIDRAEHDARFCHKLSWMFNPGTKINKSISSLFLHDPLLLQQAYLLVLGVELHGDYSGSSLGKLLDLDQQFIIKYLENLYSQKEWVSVHDSHIDYGPLWERADFEEVITLAAHFIFEKERRIQWSDGHFRAFFLGRQQGFPDQLVQERQDRFICKLIEQHCHDGDFISFLLHVISSFAPERRRGFVKKFLEVNADFEDFKRLPLEPSSWSWSGSLVPTLHARSEFLQSLVPMLNNVDFLRHKYHVEQSIQSLRLHIEHEKKKDFMGN